MYVVHFGNPGHLHSRSTCPNAFVHNGIKLAKPQTQVRVSHNVRLIINNNLDAQFSYI